MRSLTLSVVNNGKMAMADIRFSDVPDTGPGSSIAVVVGKDEATVIQILKDAAGPQGQKHPFLRVHDADGLAGLTPQNIDEAKRA